MNKLSKVVTQMTTVRVEPTRATTYMIAVRRKSNALPLSHAVLGMFVNYYGNIKTRMSKNARKRLKF